MEFAHLEGREVLALAPDTRWSRHSEGSFLRLRDGSLLFAYSRFTGDWADDAPSDIACMRSANEGETWTEARVAVPASMYGVQNVMSASMMRMANGDVGLFYLVKATETVNRVMLARSRDEGETYYAHVECSLPDRAGYYVLNNDRALRLTSGRIVLPVAFHRGGYETGSGAFFDGRGVCSFLLSDDDGQTWRESLDTVGFPFTGSGTGLQEPGVIERTDGVLWAYFRTDAMYQYESFSLDGGDRWTAAQPSRFTSPASPMKIARREATGELYAVWNPIPCYNGRYASPAGWGRTPLVYAVSADDGRTWKNAKALENDPERGFCYPAVCFTSDGCMLAAYCSGGLSDRACLARLTIRKIPLN